MEIIHNPDRTFSYAAFPEHSFTYTSIRCRCNDHYIQFPIIKAVAVEHHMTAYSGLIDTVIGLGYSRDDGNFDIYHNSFNLMFRGRDHQISLRVAHGKLYWFIAFKEYSCLANPEDAVDDLPDLLRMRREMAEMRREMAEMRNEIAELRLSPGPDYLVAKAHFEAMQ